jgi:hypothetical protein
MVRLPVRLPKPSKKLHACRVASPTPDAARGKMTAFWHARFHCAANSLSAKRCSLSASSMSSLSSALKVRQFEMMRSTSALKASNPARSYPYLCSLPLCEEQAFKQQLTMRSCHTAHKHALHKALELDRKYHPEVLGPKFPPLPKKNANPSAGVRRTGNAASHEVLFSTHYWNEEAMYGRQNRDQTSHSACQIGPSVSYAWLPNRDQITFGMPNRTKCILCMATKQGLNVTFCMLNSTKLVARLTYMHGTPSLVTPHSQTGT